jgi:hypothetical protein
MSLISLDPGIRRDDGEKCSWDEEKTVVVYGVF